MPFIALPNLFWEENTMKKLFMSLSSLILAAVFCLSSAVPAAASETPAETLPYFVYFFSEKPYSSEELVEARYNRSYRIEDGNLESLTFLQRGTYIESVSRTLIYTGCVTDYVVTESDLVFVMYNMIYSCNWSGGNVRFIFALPQSISGEIKKVSANDSVVWLQVGASVYRLYRPTGTLDFVYSNPDMLWWRPISNYTIEYAVYSEEYLQAKRDGRDPDSMSFYNEESRYYYNSLTGETFPEILEFPDYILSETPLPKVICNAPYANAIAGRRIPESSPVSFGYPFVSSQALSSLLRAKYNSYSLDFSFNL